MSLHLTIVGSGPGGYVAALRAAQLGARVTIVEDSEVGGTCLNRGCIPTKTIIASAGILEHCRSANEFGIEISGAITFSLAGIRQRKDKVVSTQVKGIRALFKSWSVELIEGRGSLNSAVSVHVERKEGGSYDIKTDRIIIATGSRPARLPGFPFDGKHVITSDEAVQLSSIPKSLLIVGAGVIGSEFAFIYRSLGAEVTVVEMMPHALATEDEEMSGIIEREMKKAKIRLITNVTVEQVTRTDDGTVVTRLSNGLEITTECVLVSIGRSLNSEQIGLESAGVNKGSRSEIIVNDKLETSTPGVYAIGDVTGKMLLAHVASHQGLIAVENALGGNARIDYSIVPAGIFTMPEIGSVGLREKQVKEQGIAYRVGRFQFRALGKSHAMGEITGMVKVLTERETDKIIGVHICGAHATDLIHEGALAMKMGATANDVGRMIHAHPTLSEAMMEACEDVHGSAIHVPPSAK